MSVAAEVLPETDGELTLFKSYTPLAVITDAKVYSEFYEKLRQIADEFEADVSTDKGRKEIASLAYKVARTKTAIDDAGKKLNEEARAKINAVDEDRRTRHRARYRCRECPGDQHPVLRSSAMNDMSSVIVPKSDQINADDLIAGPMTITITNVQIRGGQEQPVSIYFEGSEKAFRPCKSMSRVLVQGWGADASKYVGRSLTLYRDPTVKWAGLEVGGIRISHMSDIDGEKLMMLTATKGSRKPHKVQPLVMESKGGGDGAKVWADKFIANVGRAPDSAKLEEFIASRKGPLDDLAANHADLRNACQKAIADKRASFIEVEGDDPFAETAAEDTAATEEFELDARLRGFREKIDAALNTKGLAAVDGEWVNARAAYDDETAAEIDGLITDKRKSLSSGEG